jgi:hypothetical protein
MKISYIENMRIKKKKIQRNYEKIKIDMMTRSNRNDEFKRTKSKQK